MSFYNSKRRSLVFLGRHNSNSNLESEFNNFFHIGGSGSCAGTVGIGTGTGGSCGSTSSSGSGSSTSGGGGCVGRINTMTTTTTSSPDYSLQQLARSRSFGGGYYTGGHGCIYNSSPGGKRTVGRTSSSYYGNYYRTGTWNSTSQASLGVLGTGYGGTASSSNAGSTSGNRVSKKLMNSLGTLTHSNSSMGPTPLGSAYTNGGGNSGTGRMTFGSLLGGPNGLSQSMRVLPTSGGGGNGGGSGTGHVVKTPRPNKTRIAIESLVSGLNDCIKHVDEEINEIRASIQDLTSVGNGNQSQGRLYELEKVSKSSERHLKRLEYQLSIVEELGEQYSLQQKLREGVRTMAFAFSVSQGPEKESALANVKAGFRECTEMLCTLESQLECLLGTFHMEMKGIQGFARLCPGDVFEITIKHGMQKWKTKGKVGKDGSQVWDFPLATFRAVLGEVLHIKAAEVKTLGKSILLGNKFCEISELFSSHAQLMTVNLNPSGSLKLNIIVTWNPLEYAEDFLHTSSSPAGSLGRSYIQNAALPASLGSPSRKRRLSPTEINIRHSMIVDSVLTDNNKTKELTDSPSTSSNSAANPNHNTNSNNASSVKVPEQQQDIYFQKSDGNNKIQNPSSRHSALWERSLDTIEIISKEDKRASSSSLTTPSKTARTSSPEITTATTNEDNSNSRPPNRPERHSSSIATSTTTTATTTSNIETGTTIVHIHNSSNQAPPAITSNANGGVNVSVVSANTSPIKYSADPNVHRISISSTNSDPSGNFSFLKKSDNLRDRHQTNNTSSTSQIEFETNIALEELDMAIIDGDNSGITIEDAMEDFCCTDDDETDAVVVGGTAAGTRRKSSSNKSNSNSNINVLRNSVLKLASLLEDIQGQYPELEPLEMHLTTLEKMIQNPCFLNSSSSSLNIESALECFDFLDIEELSPTSESQPNCTSNTTDSNNVEDSNIPGVGVYIFGASSRYHHHRQPEILDPKMTARTTDSGISSLGHHSRSPSPTTSRNSSSPMHTVTGSNQLDMALGAHIHMCSQLINNVGSFGPLKHREKEAIAKLQQQGIILGTIISRTKSSDVTNGLLELASLPQLQVLWEQITESGGPLCASVDQAISGLESDIKSIIQSKYSQEYSPSLARKVSQYLVQQMLETSFGGLQSTTATLDRGQVLTVFQFQHFLRPHEHCFHKLVHDLTEEEILQSNLQQDLVSGIRSLPLIVPPKNVLFALVKLLMHEDRKIVGLVKNYFNAISIAPDKKRQIVETSLEMLEFPSATDRQAACLVFIELKNFWRIKSLVIEPLLYLIQSDSKVRPTAKETVLQILGEEEGEKVLQQVSLSIHGFQGLGVK